MAVTIRVGRYYVHLENEGSSCLLYFYSDHMFVSTLITDPEHRSSGKATEILTVAKRYARKKRQPLRLTAAPFSDRPFDIDRLVEFYKKRGFRTMVAPRPLCQIALMEYKA